MFRVSPQPTSIQIHEHPGWRWLPGHMKGSGVDVVFQWLACNEPPGMVAAYAPEGFFNMKMCLEVVDGKSVWVWEQV